MQRLRRHQASVKPLNSHVALNTIVGPDGEERKVLRDNMPFGNVGSGEFGTYYIAYSRSPDVSEEMLERMFIGNLQETTTESSISRPRSPEPNSLSRRPTSSKIRRRGLVSHHRKRTVRCCPRRMKGPWASARFDNSLTASSQFERTESVATPTCGPFPFRSVTCVFCRSMCCMDLTVNP
jgi:hypothetical protein